MAWVLTQKKSLYKVVCNIFSAGIICHSLGRFSQTLVQLWISTFELMTCQLPCQAVHNSQDEALLSVYSTFVLIARKQLLWHLLKDFLILLIIFCTQIMSCFRKHGILGFMQNQPAFYFLITFPRSAQTSECLSQQHLQCFTVSLHFLPYILHNGLKGRVDEQVSHRSC